MNRTLTQILFALEQRLLDPAVRRDRAAVSALLAEEFREFGRSGRAYDKAATLDLLSAEPEDAGPVTIEEFRAEPLGEAAALATYTGSSLHAGGRARRSSVWVWRDGRWQMLFHQGTTAAE